MLKKKSLIIIFISALLLLSVFGGISLLEQKNNKDNLLENPPLKGNIKISNSTQDILSEDVEQVIISFVQSYYESLATLEEKDMTLLFNINDPESFESANINQATLHYLIGHRKLQPNDLTITSYLIEIDCYSIDKKAEDTIEILLKEHSKINYSFIPDIDACTSSIEHNFSLLLTEEGWKIQSHDKSEDIYYLIEDMYLEAKEEQNSSEENSMELLGNITAELLKQSELESTERLKSKETYLSQSNEDFKNEEGNYAKKWDNDYNRLDAAAYANQWVSPNSILRNSDWFIYDDQGGNCTNFISQCLFAGGIPMDIKGSADAQWKWYSDYINSRNVARGRAPAWTGVNEFYKYSLTNSGFGLVSNPDEIFYNGEIGDIILFGTDDHWNHAVIITDIIRDENGQISDYLINSNTTDRINYPVSAYSYYNVQLIKILGWNN